jgi:nitrite reductase/ring-hydroxylating ferredoxin subunit
LNRRGIGKERVMSPDAVEVGSEAELDRRGRLVARLPEPPVDVLVVRTRRRVFAVENRCPHLGSVLDGGDVRGRVITCAAHGRRFDLRSGRGLAGPGRRAQPLLTMRAWVDGGKVWVAAPRTRPADAA